jgi:Uroporphyrinogen decarboxylase (URO-D)
MAMTMRERILAVYRGEKPDVVPYMLDLSHWFYHKFKLPWDLTVSYDKPEYPLLDYHKKSGVGFYVPNLGSFFSARYGDDVKAETYKEAIGGSPAITWRLTTPLGSIERSRIWEEDSYSWGIREWGAQTENDLRVLGYALASRTYEPIWPHYKEWQDYIGDLGVTYMLVGYSAMGHIMNYWMGSVATVYAASDWPDTLHEVVDAINANCLKLIDLVAESPAEVVCMGDNFSSDLQPPAWYDVWSRLYYTEAIRRLHAAGKFVAVHIDGRLRGAITMIRDSGADAADAVTPVPTGDLTPAQCRAEAGPNFILSGGIAPALWLPNVDIRAFERAVIEWLETRTQSPRLIANAGDQVPPGAEERRITLMRDLVEEYGRF